MQINNPLQMNDWEIKNFLGVVLAMQIAMWCMIGLDAIGLEVPILRQLVGFIYLTFIPGLLILRILRLHKLGSVETVVYAVGLSFATLMFTGLVMAFVYPFLGISGPIANTPLIITLSAVVLVLCILSYARDKNFSKPSYIDIDVVSLPPTLFLCVIPFLAILGAYLVNCHDNNILLLFLIIIIAIIAVFIGFDKFIPKSLYPLAVFVIAITLVYHNSLISMYIWGYDLHAEYAIANSVMANFQWDPTIGRGINAMLSIVMLAPIYSNICSMNLTWVFKIIYPLILSFVPLGLYPVFQKQTNDKIAFLSCFFFISFFTFYTEMLALARQEIAELFLILLILLMIDKNMDKIKRSFLFIVFGFSLVVSHYGSSYLYMIYLLSAGLILATGEYPSVQKLMNTFYPKFNRKREEKAKKTDKTISSTFILLFIIFGLAWYIYASSSTLFITIVHIGDHVASSLFTEFLNPEVAQGLNIITTETISPLHSVNKYIHLLTQFFVFVGVITLMLRRDGMKFEREYVAFSYVNFVICIAGIAVPHFASSMNTTRLYHTTLIFLAPFCIIGGVTVFKMLSGIVKVSWTNESVKSSLKILSVFFAIFLLFNSAWVYEVTKDHPVSISLSQSQIIEYGTAKERLNFYNTYTIEQDVFGARWLSKEGVVATETYVDLFGKFHVLISYGNGPGAIHLLHILKRNPGWASKSYIYLRTFNNLEGIIVGPSLGDCWNVSEISTVIDAKNKIYENGGSIIYR